MTGIERKPAAGFYQTLLRMWPLFLPVFILLPGITGFPYPPVAGAFSDLSVTHYPNALYLLRSLREWGTIPLWSPSILSGAPFAPNPLAGLWYPPGWLALLLPLPFGFNLIAAMHMIWGGWGVYCLLKSQGAQHAAALMGGIAFCSLPKLFAHYGAGHLTLIYSVCWTPWLLLASRRLPETGKVKPVRLSVEGVVLGLILLADVRWAAPAGVLWLVYVLWQRSARNLKYTWLGTAAQASIQCALAFCLAAPLLVPLIELTGLSTRANLAPAERSVLALPSGGILGLIYPGSGSTFEWVLYPGCGVLLLAILSPLVGRGRKGLFWLAVGAVSLLLALGPEFPPNRWLSALPGLNLLRVPARWLFLTGLSLAMAGGHGLDGLLAVDWVSGAARRVRLVLFGAVSASLGLGAGVWALTGDLPGGIAWGAGAMLVSALWLAYGLKSQPPAWYWGVVLVVLVDLAGVNRSQFRYRSPQSVLAEGEPAASYLAAHAEGYRVYSPSYSLPQQTAASLGLELASGVDPLQLRSYANFMTEASGVSQVGYSVTLPPVQSHPESDNARFSPSPVLLGLLNVGSIASEFDIQVEGLDRINLSGDTRLYANRFARPRAWVQGGDAIDSAYIPAGEIRWSPNRIEITAQGPGTLVLSEIAYPGWRVWVDGMENDLTTAYSILRSVHLGAGEHRVVFAYQPASLYAGLGLCLIALLVLAGWSYASRR